MAVVAAAAVSGAAAAAAVAAKRNRQKRAAEVEVAKPKPRNKRQACCDKVYALRLPGQEKAKFIYEHAKCQKFVAVLIMLNFLCTIVEKELDPPMGAKYFEVWLGIGDFFNYIFLCELAINYYGHAPLQFFESSWNVFDCIVCLMGALSLARVELPPPWTLLRCFRAFRVFRLFKRIKSLNKIMVALAKAVPGVINAFLIIVIVMCIFSIIAVEFFSEFGKEGYYNTTTLVDGELVTVQVSSTTVRGMYYGEEYYGSFTRALYSLFQVLTGESWSEAIARPLIMGADEINAGAVSPFIASIFFIVFILLNSVVLINVVVAVLLEKMVEDPPDDEEDGEDGEAEEGGRESPPTIMEGPPVITDGKDQRAETSPSSVMHAESQPADGEKGPSKAVDLEKRLNAMDARFDKTEKLLLQILGQLDITHVQTPRRVAPA